MSEQVANLFVLGKLTNPWWFYIVLGVVAGIVSGLLGLGSGIIVIPALILFCAMGQKNAQGTALALMVPMALLGAFRYWRNPNIELDFTIIALLIFGSIFGVLIGTELASKVPAHILRKIFAVFLVIVAVRMFIGSGKKGGAVQEDTSQTEPQKLEQPGGSSNGSDQ